MGSRANVGDLPMIVEFEPPPPFTAVWRVPPGHQAANFPAVEDDQAFEVSRLRPPVRAGELLAAQG